MRSETIIYELHEMSPVNLPIDDILLTIKSKTFFKNLYTGNSKKKEEKILRQFLLDFERQEIYINGVLQSNLSEVLHFIFFQLSSWEDVKYHDILTLCQQTCLAYPIEILQNKLPPEHFIMECYHKVPTVIELSRDKVIISKGLRICTPTNNDMETIADLDIDIIFNPAVGEVVISYQLT